MLLYCPATGQGQVISGELRKWHKVTLTFSSDSTYSENGTPNPFTDFRLLVTFTKGDKTYRVPGYFAADGNAANTGATSGNKWRVHFAPDEEGLWTYQVSFRTAPGIAVDDNPAAGQAVAPVDGLSGNLNILPTNKTGYDFRARGRLQYVGEHHLRFAETGEYFLKAGCNSPENLLAYYEFDGTFDNGGLSPATPTGLHHFPTHVPDWNAGDPLWQGSKGKAIIGALNYLASQGVNAIYFITLNIMGDGDDVWPYISPNASDFNRFDVSKLDQWEIVFSHADSLGILLHFVTQERENQMLLDNGDVGPLRKLYYRELIARFSHHLAVTWNMGEENGWDYQGRGTQTDQQRRDMAAYFKANDPYKHQVVIHTATNDHDLIYLPLLGNADYDGVSLQMNVNDAHLFTIKWRDSSAANGKNWVVSFDEVVGGVDPDGGGNNQGMLRELALWAHYMAGGGGVEWYFGNDDLTAEDFRTRSIIWDYTRKAQYFFKNYLPFWKMTPNDALTAYSSDFVLEYPGRVYAIYDRFGNSNPSITLPCGTYTVKWYDPTNNSYILQNGGFITVQGGGTVYLGSRPYANNDWAILITSNYQAAFDITHTGCNAQGGAISVTPSGGTPPYSYLWSDGETSSIITDLAPGVYTVTITDNTGCVLVDSAEVLQTGLVALNLKVFLEGPYDPASGLMRDDLRAAGLIPLSEPFSSMGFVHYGPGGGEFTSSAVLNVTGSNAIVDWIFVELRDKNDSSAVVASRSALLQRDGDIVDTNGMQPVIFHGVACDDYFIAIRHRNHLGFMSKNPFSLNSIFSLDFSNTSVPLYGTNPQKQIGTKRVMWAGNCNQDKRLKYIGNDNDRDLILARAGVAEPTAVVPGYFNEDINLDGVVKYMGVGNDRDIILINIGGSNPAAVRNEQLPSP
ncbi:MAG: hypothetical protein KatS3mg031_1680 [Chitinophagales bacterium]|nr:MAG: hypothetical protein KatS3mg031_1680 [Chitinophagales bacterium]